MSKEENNKVTIWTILDNLKYFLLIALFVLIVVILFKGYSIETKYFKIGKVPDTLFIEKEVKIPADTIYKEKVVTKYVEAPTKDESTKVETSKVDVSVNRQPSNINTGNNNGIIGNNNTINNFGDKPVVLSDIDKQNILKLIENSFKQIPDTEAPMLEIIALSNENRSVKLARLIRDFVVESGYKKHSFGIAFLDKEFKGVNIYPQNNVVRIDVGKI